MIMLCYWKRLFVLLLQETVWLGYFEQTDASRGCYDAQTSVHKGREYKALKRSFLRQHNETAHRHTYCVLLCSCVLLFRRDCHMSIVMAVCMYVYLFRTHSALGACSVTWYCMEGDHVIWTLNGLNQQSLLNKKTETLSLFVDEKSAACL